MTLESCIIYSLHIVPRDILYMLNNLAHKPTIQHYVEDRPNICFPRIEKIDSFNIAHSVAWKNFRSKNQLVVGKLSLFSGITNDALMHREGLKG